MIGSTDERGTITLVFMEEISWSIQFVKHHNTNWYSLKDICSLLEVKGWTSVVASHIATKNKKMFSFVAKPGYVINLTGIFELRIIMNISKEIIRPYLTNTFNLKRFIFITSLASEVIKIKLIIYRITSN